MDVMIPTGISVFVRLRARVSHITIYILPMMAAPGSMNRWSGPSSIRAAWGIMRPTQAMIPTMDTDRAVMSVASSMNMILYFSGLIPRVRASSSPMEMMFSFHPSMQRMHVSPMTGGRTSATSFHTA